MKRNVLLLSVAIVLNLSVAVVFTLTTSAPAEAFPVDCATNCVQTHVVLFPHPGDNPERGCIQFFNRAFCNTSHTGLSVPQGVPDGGTTTANSSASVFTRLGQIRAGASTTGTPSSADAQATLLEVFSLHSRSAATFAMLADVRGTVDANGFGFFSWARFDPDSVAAESGQVAVNANTLVDGHVDVTMPFHLRAGTNTIGFRSTLRASAANGGSADFTETVTLYLVLPEDVTFLGGSELFADRTDFILRPGQLPGETVPEPGTLMLVAVALAPVGYALRKAVSKQ